MNMSDRFKLYCEANDVRDSKKQRAILLTMVGAATHATVQFDQANQTPRQVVGGAHEAHA
jgi:hypothetical protein